MVSTRNPSLQDVISNTKHRAQQLTYDWQPCGVAAPDSPGREDGRREPPRTQSYAASNPDIEGWEMDALLPPFRWQWPNLTVSTAALAKNTRQTI
ncbi:hypothetical protein GRAN_3775 [Granulicella sibirica]|uniref:Uncharacterized protein n=1 Tax=Granulicella sibirica TaxID=2479048 RepID=A0A4Q0SZL6_9BACT|nr:hypothetical protein GRAN_3775 [Granulicella sibirica]